MQQVNEADQFTSVTKKSTRTVKTNSTFKVIEELIAEKSDLITKCGFELVTAHKSSGKAFLFKDATLPNTLHYAIEGFVFVDRHLRVDQFYSLATTTKGQQGFTAAHYTENYRHPHTKENITIHLYYDDACQYLQVKRYKDKENSQLLNESSVEKTVRQNAYQLIALYKKFNMEKSSRYQSAVSTADEAETAMKKQWHALASIDQIQQYIKTIDEFCGYINKVNFYNEFEKDCRDVFMRQIQEKLKARLSTLTEPSLPVKPCPENAEPQSTTSVVTVQPVTRSDSKPQPSKSDTPANDEEFATLNQLCSTLANLLKNLTPEKYLKASRIADDLNLKLLLYVPAKTNSKAKNKSKRKQLRAMESVVNSLPELYEYCSKLVMNGDLKVITALLPILNHTTLKNLFYDLHFKLTDAELVDDSQLAHKLRNICDYLHKNSSEYQELVKFSSSYLRFDKQTKMGFSNLTTAILHGKFLTFCMLLDHGYYPDGLGYCNHDLTCSQLKSAIIFAPTENYVLKLLEKGATVDAPRVTLSLYHTQLHQMESAGLANMFKKVTKLSSSDDQDFYTKVQALSLTPDLGIAVNYCKFALIPSLLSQTSIINAVFALANCTNLQGIIRRLIPHAKVNGIFFCSSREEANQRTDEIHFALGASLPVAILVYLEDKTLVKDLHYMQLLADFVKEYCQKHPEEAYQLIKQAEKMAELLPADKDVCYLMGYILLAELIRDDENNTNYRQQMMRFCCLLGADLKQKKPEYAHTAYREALSLAKHNTQLISTPMYEHAEKKHQETSAQTTYQANTYQAALRFRFNPADPVSLGILNSILSNQPH